MRGKKACVPPNQRESAATNLDGGSHSLLDAHKVLVVQGGVTHAAVVVEALFDRRPDGEVHAKLELQCLS